MDRLSAPAAPAGWEGILDEGERILWQGRPDNKVTFKPGHIISVLFGAVFAGFALFWMIAASMAGGGFWMFGLIHFTAGLAVMLGPIFWPPYARRHTWYTLTDHRAFIATDIPLQGRKLKSYEIGAKTPIDYRAGPPDTIYFAHEYQRTKNGSRRVDIGFERIENGAEVMRLIREAQKDEA
jgi:hypothetical protein